MSSVIYRKYRPQSFAQVYGQDPIVQILRQAISKQKFSHAYLFTGPRGTGKTTMARLAAKALNCAKFPELGDVCNECENCIAIDKGAWSDIVEIDAASNRSIDEVRELKESVNFLPVQGKFKVYIVDEVHMLTKEAFNALLKTLEEPPAHVVFILATTEVYKVPVTILSRVQRYDFRLASKDQVISKLETIIVGEEVKIASEILELIYAHTEGSFRDAESLLGKVVSMAQNGAELDVKEVEKLLGVLSESEVNLLLKQIIDRNLDAALNMLDEFQQRGANLLTLARQLVSAIKKGIISGNLSSEKDTIGILQRLVQLQVDAKHLDDHRLLWDILLISHMPTATNKAVKPSKPSTSAPVQPTKPIEVEISNDQSEVESLAAVNDEPGEVDMAAQWTKFMQKLKQNEASLGVHLRTARVEQQADGAWCLMVLSDYQAQKFNADGIIAKLNKYFEPIYGGEIKQVLNQAVALAAASNADLVESIL